MSKARVILMMDDGMLIGVSTDAVDSVDVIMMNRDKSGKQPEARPITLTKPDGTQATHQALLVRMLIDSAPLWLVEQIDKAAGPEAMKLQGAVVVTRDDGEDEYVTDLTDEFSKIALTKFGAHVEVAGLRKKRD